MVNIRKGSTCEMNINFLNVDLQVILPKSRLESLTSDLADFHKPLIIDR